MQWGAGGSEPHGWAGRTLASVYFLSTVGILAALTLIRYGIRHWVRSVHAGGPEFASELKFRGTVSAVPVGDPLAGGCDPSAGTDSSWFDVAIAVV